MGRLPEAGPALKVPGARCRSVRLGRLGIFWLLQSVLAVAVIDRLATGRDDAQPDGRVPLTSDERIDARVGMAEGSLAEVVDDAGS